jgi:CheY-like chemotaxis protein
MVPQAARAHRPHEDTAAQDAPVVLLVEDEVLIRLDTAEQLRACGMIVIEAANAEEAVGLLESGIKIDLVLTDVRMPGDLDGLALARLVRVHHPHIKLILCSGNDLSQNADERGDAFICKPYSFPAVAERIRQLLGPQR